MRLLCLVSVLLFITAPASGATTSSGLGAGGEVADEAVRAALSLPPGYKRDIVLRAVSRNLRLFGHPDAGIRAALAMTDRGASELPSSPGAPMPQSTQHFRIHSCDVGIWSEEDGSVAATPSAREAWADRCILERDFHWIGLPPVSLVRDVASGLPTGETKAAVLAMLIRLYADAATLRFATDELERGDAGFPSGVRAWLRELLAEPEVLYRLGQKAEALAAGRSATSFHARAGLIRLLVGDGDAESAITLFETLSQTPPPFGETCLGWFGSVGGLGLADLGSAVSPAPSIGAFLDGLPGSVTFRKACPDGLGADLEVEHLVAAGRLDAAIAYARRDLDQPFLLVDVLLQAAEVRVRQKDIERARILAIEAGSSLPPFDPGDPADPAPAGAFASFDMGPTDELPDRNFGERHGDTHRRFKVIQLLAAVGAVAEADALARAQPSGALRAVALSAAVAGRAGLRFDTQAPMLSVIDGGDL
jgi:hypothetical protein